MEQRLAGLDTDPNQAGDESKTVAYTYNGQGNVRVVSYQQDQDDAFYHYYEYDKDTRLKAVYTSTRKPDYEADDYTLKNVGEGKDFSLQASYQYYLHGPLKQVILADGLEKTDYYKIRNNFLLQNRLFCILSSVFSSIRIGLICFLHAGEPFGELTKIVLTKY